MTVPFERTRALVQTKEFLQRSSNEEEGRDVPGWVRLEAAALLRHYPTFADIELAHKALQETYGPAPPFSRLSGSATVRGVIDGSRGGSKHRMALRTNQTMRLLFLDFDGVLHPAEADPALPHFCWLPELERLLSSHTDVRIVVHSTWRYDHHDAELRALLAGLGERFVGCAPRGPRQQAIEAVLQANKGKVSSYLVLDDAPNEFEDGALNVVMLNGRAGVSDLDAQAAVADWLASSSPTPS